MIQQIKKAKFKQALAILTKQLADNPNIVCNGFNPTLRSLDYDDREIDLFWLQRNPAIQRATFNQHDLDTMNSQEEEALMLDRLSIIEDLID